MECNVLALVERYRTWVLANPSKVGDSEAILKWLSYLVAGYKRNSILLSEFLYSISHLVTFVNDRILSCKLPQLQDKHYSWIEYCLSVFETTEVFLELAGLRFGGPVGKWSVICAIQIVKTNLRLVLLLRNSGTLLVSPAIPPLNRSLVSSNFITANRAAAAAASSGDFTFTLRRSGRVIRKIEGAPPAILRDWKGPNINNNGDVLPVLMGRRLTSEIVHVLQPLAHLVALRYFGEKSWKPFLLSLSMDCASQGGHVTSSHQLTPRERQELARRRVHLLNYLLRSPFYDRRSKAVIFFILDMLHKNLPLGGSIAGALLKYLPEYQKIYFYVWGQ